MTKKSAAALAQLVNARCDDAFLFVVKAGTGYITSSKARGNWKVLLTLFLGLIDDIMGKLRADRNEDARELLCLYLMKCLTNDAPAPKPAEKLSDSQRARRATNSDRIIDAIEEALK